MMFFVEKERAKDRNEAKSCSFEDLIFFLFCLKKNPKLLFFTSFLLSFLSGTKKQKTHNCLFSHFSKKIMMRSLCLLLVCCVLLEFSPTAVEGRRTASIYGETMRRVVENVDVDAVASSFSDSDSAHSDDFVAALPGYSKTFHPHYSGYLDAKNNGTKLHYWMATSTKKTVGESGWRTDWETKPVVLWLNGGPGSSSILGMLQEQGPLIIDSKGDLMENHYSWTNAGVNLVALESPAGVGWSYCEKQEEIGCANSDKTTARDAKEAMVDFFHEKFPQLKANEFYIAGESYAGVYVPTLAMEIVEHNEKFPEKKINLVGINTADPCTSNKEQRDSMDMLWYGHKYGFVPDKDFKLLWNECKLRYPMTRVTSGRWGKKFSKLIEAKRRDFSSSSEGSKSGEKKCKVAHAKFLFSTSKAFSQDWRLAYINDLSLFGPSAVVDGAPEGSLDYYTNEWMNRADVKKALHVDETPYASKKYRWPGPNDKWSYQSDYDACNDKAAPNVPSMKDFYKKLAKKLDRILVLNGDTDPCVSYEGTRKAIENVGIPLVRGGSQRPYFFDAAATDISVLAQKPLLFGPSLAAQPAGPQMGGHVTNYEDNLTFATVHGSGHMIPQFRPRVSLHVFKKFIAGEPLSPLLPSDEELEKFDDCDEDGENNGALIDKWTTEAESYV